MLSPIRFFTAPLLLLLCFTTAFSQPGKQSQSNFDSYHSAVLKGNFGPKSGFESQSGKDYDITQERLELTVDPHVTFIQGKITFYFTALVANFRLLQLDCSDSLQIDSIFYHQSPAIYQRFNKDGLQIDLFNYLAAQKRDSFTIYYHGKPEAGVGFNSFVTDTVLGSAVLWTLSEPYGAKDWMPCKQSLTDKIDSLDIYITCPDSFQTASNGLLVSTVAKPQNQLTYHWKHRYPIATYLIAIACARYTEFYNDVPYGNDTLRIQNLVYPQWESVARKGCARLAQVMAFYEKQLGPYPFRKEKYGHAQFYWHGGMEHQTHTFVSSFGNNLLAHELAHQWFGDKVTCGSWADIWLNEGFATYFASLADVHMGDSSLFDDWRWSSRDVLLKSEPGSVYCDDTTLVSRIFDARYSYSKGAWFLHQLRLQMGDTLFFKGIRNYLNDPQIAYAFTHTPILQQHLEAVYGKSLADYFALWLYQKAIPKYTLYWWQEENGDVTVRIQQQTSNAQIAYYDLPLPVEFKATEDGGKDSMLTLHTTKADQFFHFQLNHKVAEIRLDPDAQLLADIHNIHSPVSGLDLEEALVVVPNPAHDKVYINAYQQHLNRITIYNLSGQAIRSESINLANSNTLYEFSIQDLAPGYYLLRMEQAGGLVRYKELIKVD